MREAPPVLSEDQRAVAVNVSAAKDRLDRQVLLAHIRVVEDFLGFAVEDDLTHFQNDRPVGEVSSPQVLGHS